MSAPEVFDRLLVSIHDAVLDDAAWPAAAVQIDQLCGSRGNVLVYGGGTAPDDVDIFFARACFGGERNEDCEREYFDVYHRFDERLPRLRQLPDSQVVPVAWLLSQQQMRTSLVYNEMLCPGGLGNALHSRLDGPDGTRIVWTSADPVDSSGWSSAPVEMLERILPHVRQYVRVRHALVNARALGASLSGLLANANLGVIHVDRRARVIDANDRARAILRRGDGLTDSDGALHASLSDEDDALQQVLARALPENGGAGESGSALLIREHSITRLVVHVSPIPAGGGHELFGPVGALVLVVDPEGRTRLDPHRLEEILGLTPAESQIASLLVQGRTINEIGIATGRSPVTVKWHVQNTFGKLGVSRQTDLVRVLLSLGDLAGG